MIFKRSLSPGALLAPAIVVVVVVVVAVVKPMFEKMPSMVNSVTVDG